MSPNVEYNYTKLKYIRVAEKVNVYGIVHEVVKENDLTRNNKLHSIILLKDDTLLKDETFRVHIFLPAHEKIFPITVGMIIRLHRMKVESWEGSLDGRVFRSTDIVYFPRTEGGAKFISQSKTTTFSEKDENRVQELREIVKVNSLFDNELEMSDSDFLTLQLKSQQNKRESYLSSNKNNVYNIFDCNNLDDPKAGNSDDTHGSKSCHVINVNGNVNTQCEVDLESSCVPNPTHNKTKFFLNPMYGKIPRSKKRSKSHACSKEQASPSSSKVFCQEANEHSQETASEVKEILPSLPIRCGGTGQTKTKRLVSPAQDLDQSDFDDQDDSNSPSSATKRAKQSKAGNPQSESAVSLDEASKVSQSLVAENGSLASQRCPGLACAGRECSPEPNEPVIIHDNDPMISDLNEANIIAEEEGDIPAVYEDGKTVCLRKIDCPVYGSRREEIRVSAQDLKNFQWPRYCSKVRILAMVPSLNVLKTLHPKNLLSGTCQRCGRYTFYSCLVWKKRSMMKTAMCPFCKEDGHEQLVPLEYRIKLTVMDAWGTELDLYAIKKHATSFLGLAPKEYITNSDSRKRIIELLSRALLTKNLINISFFKVQTSTKVMYYISDTCLSKTLD